MKHCGFICLGDIDLLQNKLKFDSDSLFIRGEGGEVYLSDDVVGEVTLWDLLNSTPKLHHWSHEYSGSDAINLHRLPIGTNDLYLSKSGSDLYLTDLTVGSVSLDQLLNSIPSHSPSHQTGGSDQVDLKDLPIGDSTAFLSRDIGDNLTFTDPVAGTFTLSELAQYLGPHATSHESGGSDEIDLKDLGIGGTDAFLSRSGNNLTLTDPVVGTKTLQEISSGGLSEGLPDATVDWDGSTEFSEIQPAINSIATSGQVGIRVGSYSLTSSIIIDKELSLVGGNEEKTQLSFSFASPDHCVKVNQSNCQISNLKIQSDSALNLIRLSDASNIKLQNLDLASSQTNPNYLILVSGDGFDNFSCDSCSFSGAGIQFSGSAAAKIWLNSCKFEGTSTTSNFDALIDFVVGQEIFIHSCFFDGAEGLYPEETLYPAENLFPASGGINANAILLRSGVKRATISNNIIESGFILPAVQIDGDENVLNGNIIQGDVLINGDNNIITNNIISGTITDNGSGNTIAFNG